MLDEDIGQIESLLDVKIPVKKEVDEHYEFDQVANRIREIYQSLKPLSKDQVFMKIKKFVIKKSSLKALNF